MKSEKGKQKAEKDVEEKDPNLVDWDGPEDPDNPQNMPRWRKWVITFTLSFVVVCITFASSVFSTATLVTAEQFHVSTVIMTLPTSLFVVGFAVGPPIWGPMSEIYGRKLPLFIGFGLFCIFQIPVAVAQNLSTIMVCRFFGGVFGSAPLAIGGGQLADFWGPLDRGVAITFFAAATFVGPIGGPIVGEFIVASDLGWRWTSYITAVMGFTLMFIALLVVPETYAPVLLSRRATEIRFRTKNWAIHAPLDEQRFDLGTVAQKYFLRPFAMLIFEPILILITVYMSLIYGIMYLSFVAYPIAFQELRGWKPGVGSLPFLSIGLGVVVGGFIIVYMTKTRFARIMQREGRVVPEERLIPMMIGGFLFPVGMFGFAWTSNPHITPVPQIIAGIPIGAGILMIFLQGFNYIIDVYLMYANSAIAANTLVRSAFGAGFPLFASSMYHSLGVAWASSVLAFLCVALFPVPFLFYVFGKKIRQKSRYSPVK
ncbi:bicyclomycin resistance protein [Periconia macrospinosa]|uniref:Bicyclomycin resistance protein n=1 Tax=Periconia macrospinosa TaxID=97972 RepID=A0A2V1E5G1_9PLEO|nr:bicyclomycin resistance protein [Periconia macrospinosa]